MADSQDQYTDPNAPSGTFQDDSYTQTRQSDPIPVEKDTETIESGVDPEHEDSDEQLQKDDTDAIDKSNIINDRTRGAAKPGAYREPGDEEGLPGPGDSGTSAVSQ